MNQHIDKCLSGKIHIQPPILATLLIAVIAHCGLAAAATLPNGAGLTVTTGVSGGCCATATGSYFGMDMNGDLNIIPSEQTPITGTGSIPIGNTTTATGSHNGAINGTENPAFDIWRFFGNTGMDYTRTAVTDNGPYLSTGYSTLVWRGWTVTWNFVPAIDMGTNAWQPLNCDFLGCTGWTFTDSAARFQWNGTNGGVWSSLNGSAYTLDYSAIVPNDGQTSFGGVHYYLHLVGTVTLPAFNLADDNASSPPGAPVTINVVANDTPTGYSIDSNSVAIVTPPSNGTVTVNSGNTVTYTPSAGASLGSIDTFTYSVTGNSGITSSAATVSVTVSPVTAVADSLTTNGTTPITGYNLVSNDTTVGANPISPSTVQITTGASHGTVTNNGNGTVDYQAYAGFSGIDTFKYTVKDTATPVNTSSAATVSVTVRATAPSSSTGSLSPGTTAMRAGSSDGGGLTTSSVGADSGLKAQKQCIGGCFDFKVTGLTPAGSTVKVVLPLSAAIPADDPDSSGTVYRKLPVNGAWKDFSTSGNNALASAASVSPGVCPEAGSSSYTSGLTAGNNCVQLTIVDGGADDEDGLADGIVLDPGGIGVKLPPADLRAGSTGGCSISSNPNLDSMWKRGDWWLVLGFVAWLGTIVRRRQSRA